MATKRKQPGAAAKPARGGRTPATRTAARPKSQGTAAVDPLGIVTAERDALRLEVAGLRVRIDTITAVRSELEARLNNAVAAVEKLLGR